MHSSQSLRSRFALLIALLVAGLSWLFGSLISQDASRRIAEEVGRDLAEVSYMMVDRLDRDMQSRAGMLAVLGRLRALTSPQDLEEIDALLNRLQDKFPSFAWIGFTDPHGRVLAASDGILQGVSIAQRPVYLQGRSGLFVGDVHEAVLLAGLLPNPSGEAMKFVDISLPVHAKDGSLVGVLASHLSWAWAEEVRQAILEPIQQRRNVEFFVIGQDRTVLLGDKQMVGQRLDLAALDGLGKGQSRWSLERWPDGGRYLTGLSLSHGYQDYPGLGWTVIARQPVDEAYAPAHEMQRSILLWGSALAALFALLGWLLADYVTRPLRQIAKAADRLSAGVITEIPDIRSTREISRLSQSIRHLVDSLSHQQAALGKMENLAHHDPLTGLPNRAALEKFLASAAQHCPEQNNHLALLYLDLDGFKPVNDRFGHAAGDQLLQEVAARLRGCLRDGDLVARLGGDEFVMVLRVPGAEALPQARLIAQRVLNVLSAPLDLGKHQASVSCSIGGAIWPQDHRAIEQALELADKALYRAKHAGKNCAEFHVPPSQEANASAPPAAPHGTQIAPS
ncbi:diguanylate cyclase [Pseudomonas sp. LPB0260]|uniref:sensor domain-containing diguanylate cyclase n=1 Tax=Pseudomonas sp. LPB0260 TaxID=2614442 RepID=UPI0015C2929C|nr:diguanylate cyclase [Pseudomonas sp. LPB0260]QLC74089.1 diguanylate cyclase [Pseudomonas sp. LPB0260]QLC76860.1 diguanylate cyclase [Pseudomonas sp. LPB0260]